MLQDFHVVDKLFKVTTDSASNMSAMINELHALIPSFNREHHWIRCVAHTVNLAVMSLLQTGFKNQTPSSGDESLYHLSNAVSNGATAIYDSEDESSNEDADSNNATTRNRSTNNRDNSRSGDANPLNRLRDGIIKIRASPNHIRLYRKECAYTSLRPLRLIIDSATRWNSTLAMIMRGLEQLYAYNRTCLSTEYRHVLGRYSITDSDVVYLKEVVKVLTPFEVVSRSLSGERYPTIDSVTFKCNLLFTVLEKTICRFFCQSSLSLNSSTTRNGSGGRQQPSSVTFEGIKADYGEQILTMDTTSLADNMLKGSYFCHRKLAKYYYLTGSSDVYYIATCLNPTYKRSYWISEGWDSEMMADATLAVENAWLMYKPNDNNAAVASETHTTAYRDDNSGDSFEEDDDEHDFDPVVYERNVRRRTQYEQLQRYPAQVFDQLEQYIRAPLYEMQGNRQSIDEQQQHQEYAQQQHQQNQHQHHQQQQQQQHPLEGVNSSDEPLLWWEREVEGTLDGSSSIPELLLFWRTASRTGSAELALMARDFLSIQATSCSCERIFSRAKRLVTSDRNRLNSETIRSSLVISYWIAQIDQLEALRD
ncbi:hypothetical protein MBANPS3_011515 [Mucor bainieri]